MVIETALGIDLGTSGAKAVLVDGQGDARAIASAEYPIAEPRPGWAEQDPEANGGRRCAVPCVPCATNPMALHSLPGSRPLD